MNIDPSEIDAIQDEQERKDFLTWLQVIRDYALKSFGMAKPEPASTATKPPHEGSSPNAPVTPPADEDAYGDIILRGWKKDQRKASLPKKTSGWMSIGMPKKTDDKHI